MYNTLSLFGPRPVLAVMSRKIVDHELPRSQPAGTQNQAAALRTEGVTVTTGPLGELYVDFAEYGWFPDILPSEDWAR